MKTTRNMLLAALTALATMTLPAAAHAATQTKTDFVGDAPDAYWGTPEIAGATWTVDSGTVTFALQTAETDLYVEEYNVFLDTTGDGVADYAMSFYHGANNSPQWSGGLHAESGDACTQNVASPGTPGTALAVSQSADGKTATVSFPQSSIGGASTFRWAVQGIAYNLGSGNGLDYMPDDVNDCPPATSDYYTNTIEGNARLSKGFVFPSPPDPGATLNTPADGATYDQNAVVNADYSCTDYTGHTPPTCYGSGGAGNLPSGTPIDTSSPGQHQFSVTATDDQHATTVVTHTYNVQASSNPPGGPGDPGTTPTDAGTPSDPGTPNDPGTPPDGPVRHLQSLVDDDLNANTSDYPTYVPECDESNLASYDQEVCDALHGTPKYKDQRCRYLLKQAREDCNRIWAQVARVQKYTLKLNVLSEQELVQLALTSINAKPGSLFDLNVDPVQLTDSHGNVVAVGAGNIVGVGSGGVVGVGAGNVVGVGAGNVVGVGSGNVVAVGAGNVVSVGAGNLVIQDGAHAEVGSDGTVRIIDRYDQVVAVGSGNVVGVGAGNVVAVGAGNVVSVGAGNVVGVGSGGFKLALTSGNVVGVGAGGFNLSKLASITFTAGNVTPGLFDVRMTSILSNGSSWILSNGSSGILSNGSSGILSNGSSGILSNGSSGFNKVSAAAAKKPSLLASGSVKSKRPGVSLLRVKFTAAGRKALLPHGKKRKALKLSFAGRFRPRTGKPIVLTRSAKLH